MTCEAAFDRYLALDRNERVPLQVTLHLLVCPACRAGVRHLTLAETVLAAPLGVTRTVRSACPDCGRPDPVIAAAMARIASVDQVYPAAGTDVGRVSMTRWLVSGMALVVGFMVFPFSSMGVWSRAVFGDAFGVPFYILCGVAITAWCGLFVGTNIDFFVKKFGLQHTPA
jgi:hypothetical protein